MFAIYICWILEKHFSKGSASTCRSMVAQLPRHLIKNLQDSYSKQAVVSASSFREILKMLKIEYAASRRFWIPCAADIVGVRSICCLLLKLCFYWKACVFTFFRDSQLIFHGWRWTLIASMGKHTRKLRKTIFEYNLSSIKMSRKNLMKVSCNFVFMPVYVIFWYHARIWTKT